MRYRKLGSRYAVNASVVFTGVMAALSLAAIGSARATTIDLDLGTPPHVTSNLANSFDGLNGIGLHGQTLSLHFQFSHGEFVRLFSVTSNPFVALLKLQTNSSGALNFLHGTGFLVDQHGNALDQPQQLGSAVGSNGSLAVGLFPLLPGNLQRPLDFFGIHLDLRLPEAPSISITGEEFLFKSNGNGPFGIGPGVPANIVPEQGSTLFLLSLALLGPILARVWLQRVS